MEEFDQHSLEYADLENQDQEIIEENMSTKNNDRALQIIQENSEILGKLLSKKTSPCSPGDPILNSTGCSPKDGTPYPECLGKTHNDSNGCLGVPGSIPMSTNKRKISHTSSNGSSSSNPSVKSQITLQSNPATKPITFNPFPNSARANRKPKEVGRKLGLYK